MGAWGYKVFDNDTSCAFMLGLQSPVEKLLKKKHVRRYEYDDFRAAAEFVIRMSPCYTFDNEELVEPLLTRLRTILADQDWICDWDNRTRIRRSLVQQIAELEKISKRFKRKFS